MKIALLGDTAPFGRYCARTLPGIECQFADVADFLKTHDVIIGNLETPFADGCAPIGSKSAHICAHSDSVSLLSFLGITHVTLANNHIADYGSQGLAITKRVLDGAGIEWFGVEGKGLRLETCGERIAMIGYCSMNTNPLRFSTKEGSVPNLLDVDDVVGEMARNARDGFLSVVAVHSGQEHVHTPASEDVIFARALARKFKCIYYGHHPHVVQGAETVNGSPILYSLGNFVFDDVYTSKDSNNPLVRMSEANRTGAIASVEVVGGEVVGCALTPIYLGTSKVEIGESVKHFPIADYSAALRDAGTPEYEERRQRSIRSYIDSRKAMRNLEWYLRRLNFNSIGIVAGAHRNARMHRRLFTEKLAALAEDQV